MNTEKQCAAQEEPPPRMIVIDAVIDQGTIVTLAGSDAETSRIVQVHFDHRQFAGFWRDWSAVGCPQPLFWEPSTGTISFSDGEA